MPGPWDDYATSDTPAAAAEAGPWSDYADKPFLEKLGNFWRKVQENPPPLAKTISGAVTLPGDVYAGRADPLSEEGIGRAADLASVVSPMAPRGTGGIFARPTAPAGTPIMPPRPTPSPSAADPALEAAGRLGVAIPRYMATESTAIPQLAAGIKNVPMAGQPIVSSAERLAERLGTVKKGLGAGTAETAGERAKTGLTGFIKTESQTPVSEAYRAVDELIDPAIRVPLDNTRAMVGEIMAERTAARIPGRSKAVETVFAAVQDPAGMDYKGTKGLRSFLGEKSPQELAVSGLAPTEVKRLYGALTKDLGAVVRESSPEAFGKWQEANALARLTNMQREALSKVTGAAGDAAPEAVFNRLVAFANSKAGADLNRLRLAKRAMGPDAWNDVGSALIQRLGQAPDGQFSAQRFVTAFGNMAPAARNELFSGQQHAALQDLFTVSQFVKDRIGRFENTSGTSRGMFGGGMLTGALADPITIIGGMVGTRLLAEALSRPAIVRAASAVTRAQLRGNPVAMRRAQQQLYNIALRAGLVSATQPIERRQAGGPVEENQPYLVGEAGPELFVPDDDPWARAAARTGRRGRQEGAGTRFVEGGYGVPSLYKMLDKGAQAAFEEGGKLQHYGNEYYDAGPVTQQALGAAGAPLVGPAQAGAVLGAGAIRRAAKAAPAMTPEMEAYRALKPGSPEWMQARHPEAKYPQYAEQYPPTAPPEWVEQTDPKKLAKGNTGWFAKQESPEAKEFLKERQRIMKEMDEKGYDPYFDPEKRFDVDPKNYPLNVDTIQIVPKTLDTLSKHFNNIGSVETRKALQDAYEKGVEIGKPGTPGGRLTTQDWYMMGQLEQDLVRQLGEKAGREAFKEKFATAMAATTGGMNPRANLIAGGYQNYLAAKGQQWPAEANLWPSPVGARYGKELGKTAQRIQDQGGFAALGEQNPKRHNFAGDFMGHTTPGTMDEQMTALMQPGKTQPDWYGLNEHVMAQEAAKRGVDPRKFQETGWAGFKGEAGGPMIQEVNHTVERIHRLTGMPREEIIRRGWGTGDIPIYTGGAMPINVRDE